MTVMLGNARGVLLLVTVALLSGCGLGTFVYPDADPDGAAIIENTSDSDRRHAVRATLVSVDGEPASDNGFLGAPVRVFVKPGRHKLLVACSYNRATNIPDEYEQTLTLDLQAGYVYRLVPRTLRPRYDHGPCRTKVQTFPQDQ